MKERTPPRKEAAEIRAVVERMTLFADWLKQYKPACTVITLWPKDFDSIYRYPDFAAIFQIVFAADRTLRWRGFTLTTRARDKGPT
jgi:hypothetical protein